MNGLDLLWVALLGGLVGTGELITRYRDAPTAVLRSAAALFYIALNALAAILALAMVRAFGLDFGLPADSTVRSWVQVLAAGFSALAVLRMSFFTLRAGDQDIGIGPSSLLQILLGASDRAVDRMRARARATEVAHIMAGVVFAKAAEAVGPKWPMASRVARTTISRLVPRVRPTMAPRACMSQCGAPRPAKAGTTYTPPVSRTPRAMASVSAASRTSPSPSRSHWIAAPAMNTLPSSA